MFLITSEVQELETLAVNHFLLFPQILEGPDDCLGGQRPCALAPKIVPGWHRY